MREQHYFLLRGGIRRGETGITNAYLLPCNAVLPIFHPPKYRIVQYLLICLRWYLISVWIYLTPCRICHIRLVVESVFGFFGFEAHILCVEMGFPEGFSWFNSPFCKPLKFSSRNTSFETPWGIEKFSERISTFSDLHIIHIWTQTTQHLYQYIRKSSP